MEVEFKLESGRKDPKIIILAEKETQQLRDLMQQLARLPLAPIQAWQRERSFFLQQEEILRFYTEGKGVMAQAKSGNFSVRLRLYELEERVDTMQFIRISNSEIINIKFITGVDLSLTGTIRMTLGEGEAVVYVSRRYVKKIKEILNLGRKGVGR
ncbi:MAG: LytTR family DNA-binding domain-containing protein [Lawsonibacter sp.]